MRRHTVESTGGENFTIVLWMKTASKLNIVFLGSFELHLNQIFIWRYLGRLSFALRAGTVPHEPYYGSGMMSELRTMIFKLNVNYGLQDHTSCL